jgi:Ca2+-binding EF-hand superfamily protein
LEGAHNAGLTHYTNEDVQRIIKEIDMTGSKTIFYTEFIAATIDLPKLLAQYEDDSLLHALYKDFDHQDIDMLTVANLTASLTRMGKEITMP